MGLLDNIKFASEVAAKLANVELKDALAAAQMDAVELAEQNVRLRQELLDLRETARLRESLISRDNVYWLQTAEGEEDGPFCQTCWDGSQKQVRLIDEDRNRLFCALCKQVRWKPGGRARRDEQEQAARASRPRRSWNVLPR